jgi:phospholipase/carboxylesterase
MALALGLGRGRPRPAAIVGFSGFLPEVDGWELDTDQPFPPIAIGHGTLDPVIPIEFGRSTSEKLVAAGAKPLYREYPEGHTLDSSFLLEVRGWLCKNV